MKFAEHRRRRGIRWSRVLFVGVCFACAAFAADPQQNRALKQPAKPIAYFNDVAKKAGLTMVNTFGGVTTKKYIIETTGTGVAIFDADNDGWPDIFIVNGTKLEEKTSAAKIGKGANAAPSNHLYHNNHDGTFTDITRKAGLVHTGWGQGVCVGDYDSNGWHK